MSSGDRQHRADTHRRRPGRAGHRSRGLGPWTHSRLGRGTCSALRTVHAQRRLGLLRTLGCRWTAPRSAPVEVPSVAVPVGGPTTGAASLTWPGASAFGVGAAATGAASTGAASTGGACTTGARSRPVPARSRGRRRSTGRAARRRPTPHRAPATRRPPSSRRRPASALTVPLRRASCWDKGFRLVRGRAPGASAENGHRRPAGRAKTGQAGCSVRPRTCKGARSSVLAVPGHPGHPGAASRQPVRRTATLSR
jgi:hypothetical protein